MHVPDGPRIVIVNPRAGGAAADDRDRIARALFGDCEIHGFSEGEDPRAVARGAVARQASAVIAVGGDGTVSRVAAELVGSSIPLGVVPRGTSNSIASALGIPHDLDAACAVIARDHVRIVDTARVNGRTMLLMATIGVHARTIADTPDGAKAALGVLAYVSKGVELLVGAEPFDVELRVDDAGTPLRASVHALTVANLAPPRSVFAQGPPEVRPADGALDVTLLAFEGMLDALATSVHLLRSAIGGVPATRHNVGFLRARRMTVHACPAQPLTIDGEPAGTSPLEIDCRPGTLAVFVPPA